MEEQNIKKKALTPWVPCNSGYPLTSLAIVETKARITHRTKRDADLTAVGYDDAGKSSLCGITGVQTQV